MTGKRYSQSEIELIYEMAGNYSRRAIAKRLGRTEIGVNRKMASLGIGFSKDITHKINKTTLSTLCNVDIDVVTRWISKGLKAVKKFNCHLIDSEDFWKWAYRNKTIINFAKIEKDSIPPEPDWVTVERRKDMQIPKRQGVKWNQEEERFLLTNIQKLSMKNIAEHLNRTEKAVQRKISRLKEEGELAKEKIIVKWTEEDLEMLIEMDKQGIKDSEIAWELGREVEHIIDKRRRLREQGKYPKHKKEMQVRKTTNCNTCNHFPNVTNMVLQVK